MNIVHWGAGKLGLSLAAWNAHCGHDVVCVDVNANAVQAINEGRPLIDEPQVQELLATHSMAATCDQSFALWADIIFIIVPTPSLKDGSFSLEYVEQSCRDIGAFLPQKSRYTLIVCVSTIMPGGSRKAIAVIEEASGKKCGDGWAFCYSPEFVRQGSVVQDYANPDVLLIGASDIIASMHLELFYNSVVQGAPTVHHMSLESAEIAKVGLNAAVVTKIAVANQLAWLCHHTPGANAGHVLDSIGADPRIGCRYFNAGLWPGGPCFPRDTAALGAALISRSLPPAFPRVVSRFSVMQARLLAEEVLRQLDGVGGSTVGLLGLTYKPGVSLLDESQSLEVVRILTARNRSVKVIAYDPDVAAGASVQTLHELVAQSDVIVLMTPKRKFKWLERMDLSGKILFDCWGYIGETNAEKHIVLGIGE